MFQMVNSSSRKTRIVCVPVRDKVFSGQKQLWDLDPSAKREIEQYFADEDPLDDESLRFDKWGSRDEAWQQIDDAHASFLRLERDYVDNFQGGGN